MPEGGDSPDNGGNVAERQRGRGPRGPHDTLQPQDESIIVGYYTSAEVLFSPYTYAFSKQILKPISKGVQWQETTESTVQ